MYVSSEYSGRPFIPYLDELAPVVREDTGPFRMPISDKYKVNIVSFDVHIMHSHAHCMIITTTFFTGHGYSSFGEGRVRRSNERSIPSVDAKQSK